MNETSAIDTIRENLRLQQVYNVMMRYGMDMLFSRFGLLDSLRTGMQRWVWHLPNDLEDPSLPTKARLMLEELGPTYVKVGQIVSSQASVIPPDWEEELAKLQSDVPPFPAAVVRSIIQTELKATPEELFASFSPTPFAAASTAQVHRARLHDGTEVVVKVQRPNIQTQMKADVGIMTNASRVLSRRISTLSALDLPGMVEEFGSNAIRELNYLGEAFNALRLEKNMATCPGVHIPKTFSLYSTTRVLTMEFVHGVKISNLEAIEAAGLDRATLATNTLRAMLKQMMIDGFFHADPHPGNLLVNLDTRDVTFIDMGMVGELEPSQRLNLIQVLMALNSGDVNGVAMVFKNLSEPFIPVVDEKAYYKDFERTLGPYMYSEQAIDFAQSLTMSMDVLRRNGLRLDRNLTLATKAMMQVMAISGLLFPEGHLLEESVKLIKELAMEQVTAENVQKVVEKTATTLLRELAGNLPSLEEATLSWFKQYQKGRFEVYVDTSGVAKEVNKINQLGLQVVVGLILVGLIIGSSIATTGIALGGYQGDFWDFISKIAVLSYVISSVLAGLIVLRLLWRWVFGKEEGAV
jgi:ubiquinone biosynthesis protein